MIAFDAASPDSPSDIPIAAMEKDAKHPRAKTAAAPAIPTPITVNPAGRFIRHTSSVQN
jgi:hypothetical protein